MPSQLHPARPAAAPPLSMPTMNLPIIEEATASPEVSALYEEFCERFGRPHVPGTLKCFATHPPLLEHMMGLAEAMLFSEGALGRSSKELIATFLSARNQCAYCADSHGAALLQQSHSPDLLQAAIACDLASPALEPSQQALLHFVGKINDHAGRLDSNDVAEVRATGWTDLQIAEAVHLAALFACFNRVVSAFGVPSQELLPASAQDPHSIAGAQ